MRKQFKNTIWYAGEKFDPTLSDKYRSKNIEVIFKMHTWERRMNQLYEIINKNSHLIKGVK
jgi:hypothetical protein